ncbi:MAG: hypothetical protein KF886_22035 [Candidatus Hydrogenedentes bacterium]|nr:hypothetical protein [Candidatus Hydrogenedentota bacterium]
MSIALKTLPWLLALPLAAAAPAADVDAIMAQFPAPGPAQANGLFDALIDAGEDTIASLCDRLVPLGATDDNAPRYALTGLARYASRPDAGRDRDVVEDALLNGLDRAKHPDIQSFLIRQLQQCGTNRSVSALRDFVAHEQLASDAILALEAIGTAKARRALAAQLSRTSGDTQLRVIAALAGDGKHRRAARAIRNRLEAGADANETVHLLSLLASVAGAGAHPDLIDAAGHEAPRVRKAALLHAAELMDARAARKWRKALDNGDLPDDAKAAVMAMLEVQV